MTAQDWVGLAEAVRAVRSELAQATAEGHGSDVRFEVGPIELELVVDVRAERAAEGGVKISVISLGAKGSRSQQTTNRLKVTLQPIPAEGDGKLKIKDVPDINPDDLG